MLETLDYTIRTGNTPTFFVKYPIVVLLISYIIDKSKLSNNLSNFKSQLVPGKGEGLNMPNLRYKFQLQMTKQRWQADGEDEGK